MTTATTRPLRVGFVGLGRMGHPMAARLFAAGFPLRVFDTRPAAVESFVSAYGESPLHR